jgi:phosphoglycerol transferase
MDSSPSPPGIVDPRHLPLWLAIALALALGLAVMSSHWVLESGINPEIPLSPPRIVHNATASHNEVWVGPNRGPHAEVDWDTSIRPHRDYLIAISFDNPGKFVSPRVNVDLYGKGYDNAEQQFLVIVPTSTAGYRAAAILNSGAAPPAVSLRVFHFDPARVGVARVSLRQISRVYDAARTLVILGLAVALAGVCASCVVWLRRRGAQGAPEPTSVREWWLLAALLSVLVVILFNGFLGPPQVYADEYAYLATVMGLRTGEWAGLRDTTYQQLPNRLFFAVYELSAFAKNPVAAARILGALWVAAALVPLYVVARTGKVLVAGLFVGLAYVLGPIGTYSAYFTPEAMFAATFTAACVLAAFALESRALSTGIAAAAALAALPYLKPNGWAVVAAMALFVAARALRQRQSEAMRVLKALLLLMAVCAAVWMALRLALPDVPSRTQPLGIYAGVGARALMLLKSSANYPLIGRYLLVHLVIVVCITGPALAYGLQALFHPTPGSDLDRGERIARSLTALVTVMLLALVAMTAVFSASFAGHSPSDNAGRLHMRYYDFALPLLVLAFAASSAWREWPVRTKSAVTLTWAIAALAAALALPRYNWGVFDSPDLFAGDAVPGYAIGGLGLAGAALAWMLRRRTPKGVQIAMLGAYVVAALGAGVAARVVQYSWETGYVDRAGRFVASLAEETGSPIVAVMHPAGGSQWIYRFASYAPTHTRFLGADQLPLAVAEGLPSGTILAGAPQDLPRAGVALLAHFGSVDVARLTDPIVAAGADHAGSAPTHGHPFVVSFGIGGDDAVRVVGLHPPEAWGAWSAAPEIRIKLPFEIRGGLRLALDGRALGPNVGRPLTLTIGPHTRTFTLNDPLATVDLNFSIAEPENTITISGIQQVAASSLGLTHDNRQLGIGLSWIRITPR